jgi:tryptophan-rich sensory protein
MTRNNIDYNSILKPPLAPPGYIFPIVWTIIYLLMGISYFLYKKKDNEYLTNTIYYLQLIINILWSIIFFIWKLRLIAILWILLLDILVLYLYNLYLKNNKISAYLLIPYILWLILATYLAIGIYILN